MKQKNSSRKMLTGILIAGLTVFPTLSTLQPSVHAVEKRKLQKQAPAHVSLYEELKAKLEDPNGPEYIILDQDLKVRGEGGFENDIDIKGNGRKVTIDGGINKHKIIFSTKRSMENDNDIETKDDNQDVTFKNISFVYTGKNGAVIGGTKSKINFENIDAKGKKFINVGNPTLALNGEIKANTHEQTIHADKYLYINSGANVDLYSKTQHAIFAQNLLVNSDTHVKARNDAPNNAVVCISHGNASFQSGSNVDFGINSGNSMALGSWWGPSTFTFYANPIGTWDKPQVHESEPTFYYPQNPLLPTDTIFYVAGFGQKASSVVLAGSTSFASQFAGLWGKNKPGSANYTGRFATGDFVAKPQKKKDSHLLR